jgi:hypothetical protein
VFAYTVTCRFEDDDIERAFVEWLQNTHIRDVCAAGAQDAEIVRLDRACEIRYHFGSRRAFEDYERDHAPRLRAEGLARAQGRVTFARTMGDVIARYP